LSTSQRRRATIGANCQSNSQSMSKVTRDRQHERKHPSLAKSNSEELDRVPPLHHALSLPSYLFRKASRSMSLSNNGLSGGTSVVGAHHRKLNGSHSAPVMTNVLMQGMDGTVRRRQYIPVLEGFRLPA
jgi:hypothetical protein